MATARKVKRADKKSSGKARKKAMKEAPRAPSMEVPDPLSPENRSKLFWRIGLPMIGVWLFGGLFASVTDSTVLRVVALALPLVGTLTVGGVLYWTFSQTRKARNVADILSKVESDEDRQAALEQIGSKFKGTDPAGIFAKAQLLMQQDPKQALEVLEQIDLEKVMPNVADEARAQRGMIHLLLGEARRARDLADGIDLNRHQELRSRAMMAAVIGEAWARTGQAKRATDTLEIFDPEQEELEKLRPQLYRARAYAYAYASKTKPMKKALRKLMTHDVRLLGSFLQGKTHPLLMKEAKKMLEQSGQVPKKMQVQRRL